MRGYNDAHRLFVQVFVAKKMLTEKETETAYLNIGKRMEIDTPPDLLNEFIKTINNELIPLFLEIRTGRAEDTGDKYFALVNSLEDEPAKLATDFTPQEIEFIKKVIEVIVVSPDGIASSTDLINLSHILPKKLTGQAAQELLITLSSRNWLAENKGQISLGPRSVIELGQYLENKFKENMTVCEMCHTVVIMGDVCCHCDIKIHKYCIATRFQGLPADKRTCPSCKKSWSVQDDYVKEEDTNISESQSDESEVLMSTSSQRAKRSRRL